MSTGRHSLSQALYAHRRSAVRTRVICADYALYDARKAEWIAQNRGATVEQYEAAIRAIARACGV